MVKKKKPKPKPQINYPPVPTKKWIPPDKREKPPKPPPAYVKPEGITQKLTISSLKKVWNKFEIIGESAILLGHYCQTYKKYTFKTNGYQGACNCAVASIFSYMFKTSTYTRYSIDNILDLGDALYAKSIQQPENLCVYEITPERVFNSLFLGDQRIAFILETKNRITDRLTTITEDIVKATFKDALTNFFKLYPVGIFSIMGKHLAIWIQDDAYFLFDPTEHEENGELWKGVPGWGFAIIYRCKELDCLVSNIYNNVNCSIQNTTFEITGCVVQRIIKINTVPPETFEEVLQFNINPPHELTEDQEDMIPVDIVLKKIEEYISNKRPSIASKVTEINPEISATKSLVKRPSWLGTEDYEKADYCQFQIPKVELPKKISYYTELTPDKMGILRGTTCQTDPTLSKYQGRQSMGNAISALVMLRIYKAQDWVPRTVNTILKNGDLLYRDAMISIPRTQSLKLSNFQRKIEYEGRFFMPTIEDCSIVGKLQSRDENVVDLEPALEHFLLDNDCCVITGPLTLAVWMEENKYFMFDPNERDILGKAIRTGTLISLEQVPGTACVTWFTKLKDLIELYMNNVEKSKKMDTFYLNHVKIDDYVEIPEIWYNFKGLEPGKWILRGTMSQSDPIFNQKSRNLQSPGICLVALTKQLLKPLKDWAQETVDEIVTKGDELYTNSIDYLIEKGRFQHRMLMVSDVLKKMKIEDKEAHYNVEECFANGILNGNMNDSALKKELRQYFVDNDMAVLVSRELSFAIWKKDNYYYCFDSHDRDENGLTTNYGTACVLRTQYVDDLSDVIETNLKPGKEDTFNIHKINIKFYELGAEEDFIIPPLNNYTQLLPGKAILRSIYSEISNKFGICSGKQTIPMCLVALGFNRLKPALEWSKADVDEILNKGNHLYIETMNEIHKKEEEELKQKLQIDPSTVEEEEEDADKFNITSINVKNEFFLGVNNFSVEFEEIGEGNIKEDLRNCLRTFYSNEPENEGDHQETLLETKFVKVSIWKADDVYFVFDSKPRDKRGFAVNLIQWMNPDGTLPNLAKIQEQKIAEERAAKARERKAKRKALLEQGEDVIEDEGFDFSNFNEGEAAFDQYFKQVPEEDGESAASIDSEDELAKYFPLIVKSSSFWKEKEKAGKACVLWFVNLNDMVDHVYNNIPGWERKSEDFTLKKVKMTNAVHLRDILRSEEEKFDPYGGDWYFFQEVEYGKWILRGTMTLSSELFPKRNRGKQIIPACYAALAVSFIFKMVCFNDKSVDSILSYGDKLYTYVKRLRKKQILTSNTNSLTEDEVDWLLEHEEFEIGDVPKKMCISKFMVEVNVVPKNIIGDIKAQNFEDVFDVTRGLEEFFKSFSEGIMQAKGLSVAIWKGSQLYYMFDGFARGPNGVVSPYGTACVLRYLSLSKMADDFLKNLPKHGKNNFYIHGVTMVLGICPRLGAPKHLNEPMFTVKTGGFKEVVPGKRVICGTISQEDSKFGKGPNVLSAPIAIIALTMTLLHKSTTWSKLLLDEIIELGNELFEETVFKLQYDFDVWQDKMDIYKVMQDYKIGSVKANCEIRMTTQEGIIDTKNEHLLNLRQGIENFFIENTHGVLVSEPLTLAIWEGESVEPKTDLESNTQPSEPVIYIFDPNPRSPTGMPLFTGTACLVSFVNAAMAADHIISCISQPELRMSEFTIVPVEIVVGTVSTKRKIVKTQTKSELTILPRCTKAAELKEKRILRKIGARERKIKEAKRLNLLGRKVYYPLKNNTAIIRGYLSQNSKIFCKYSRNNQDIPNCIAAVVMDQISSVEKWNSTHIDMILKTGDQLYIDSYIAYAPKDPKLGMENIMRKFYMNSLLIHVTIYKPIIAECFTGNNLAKVLNVYFTQETFCILTYKENWITIFYKNGFFYLFDPHERNIEGGVLKENETGTAVTIKIDELDTLVDKLLENLSGDNDEIERYTLWLLAVTIKTWL